MVHLQVGRQGQHEEAIDGFDRKFAGTGRVAERVDAVDAGGGGVHVLAHVDAEAKMAEQEQGLL